MHSSKNDQKNTNSQITDDNQKGIFDNKESDCSVDDNKKKGNQGQDENDIEVIYSEETQNQGSSFKNKNQDNQIKQLQDKIDELQKEKKIYLENWQKAQADFVNLRKRDEADKLDFLKFANLKFAEDLIPLIQSFDIALSDKKAITSLPQNWQTGFNNIYNQFLTILKNNGLEEINPINQKFDPKEHEAISIEKTDNQSLDQTITNVFTKGYRLAGRVIIPAKVIIANFEG